MIHKNNKQGSPNEMKTKSQKPKAIPPHCQNPIPLPNSHPKLVALPHHCVYA